MWTDRKTEHRVDETIAADYARTMAASYKPEFRLIIRCVKQES